MVVPGDIVTKVGRRLTEHAGLELPAWVLESRIADRLGALGIDAHGYLGLVNAPHGRGELHALVEAVRVGETRFFRHGAQVQALVDVVVPAWRARGGRQFRAWSAGCATGEEPYTLALVLSRLVPRGALSILATDVSGEALAVARRARYPAATFAHVPPEWQTGVVIEGDRLRVRADVAGVCTFERHNLVDDEAPRGFDLVWCRNVLIYFGAAARAHAIEHLVAACDPGGYVFVGYSEFLREVAGLETIRAGECVIYRRDGDVKPAARPRPPTGPAEPAAPVGSVTRGVPPRRTPAGGVAVPPALVAAPAAPSLPAPRPPAAPAATRLALRGHCDDAAAVAAELAQALARPGLGRLVVDLDLAEFLGDAVAPVLRRARAAARASGVEVTFLAARPGARRWLRRHRLDAPTLTGEGAP
jgi:chemotaxis protein methyltransferase CheR